MNFNVSVVFWDNLTQFTVTEGLVAQIYGSQKPTVINLELGASFQFQGVFASNTFKLHGDAASWTATSNGSHAVLTHENGDSIMIPGSASLAQTIEFADQSIEFMINTDDAPVLALGDWVLNAEPQKLMPPPTVPVEPEEGENTTEPTVPDKFYLTVTEQQLRDAVSNGTYAIESEGITYTFGDSKYNIDTSQVTNMYRLFNSKSDFNEDIGYWDVSNVTNMQEMFQHASSFNQDIGSWDVSNVVNMQYMFRSASSFNQDIGDWDVFNVTNMNWMFNSVSWIPMSFNQDLTNWTPAKISSLPRDFSSNSPLNLDHYPTWGKMPVIDGKLVVTEAKLRDAIAKKTYVIEQDGVSYSIENAANTIDTSRVTNMDSLFRNSEFNGDINHWDVSSVTSMQRMFEGTSNFNQPLDKWDVSSVTSMKEMFKAANSFNQNINSWDVSSVTNMFYMFSFTPTFNQPLNDWDVSSVIDMNGMLNGAQTFNRPIDSWDVSNVQFMNFMFSGAKAFNQPLNSWDVSNVTNMNNMFAYNDVFNQPLSNWDVTNVTSMREMFYKNSAFSQDISSWWVPHLSGVTPLYRFDNTSELAKTPDFLPKFGVSILLTVDEDSLREAVSDGSFAIEDNGFIFSFGDSHYNVDTSQITDMSNLFADTSFNQNINYWNLSNVTDISGMFDNAISFNQALNNWDVSNVTNFSSAFEGARNFNQSINDWDVSSAIDMSAMFKGAQNFNQLLDKWTPEQVKNMDNMFNGATNFNQDISGWAVIIGQPEDFAPTLDATKQPEWIG
ncbi:BspA family leucine-rich repeat surface protein [Thiomicrospira microaerophila]|uniref:BspA family leucine-rich repeat surface protein n=1 Tax=Thiomicrospira microaerophila TaxID=406020 RepID=UPI000698246B|nr:BspA family leucine-rich repeat surface protein [Thiomicrospira microaerophila]